jgi:large subunit ribosomal protein L18
MYAQVIDDRHGVTLASASTLAGELKGQKAAKLEAAKAVGQAIGKVCTDKGIKDVVFDRNGFLYHGRVQAVAEGAREAGLNF